MFREWQHPRPLEFRKRQHRPSETIPSAFLLSAPPNSRQIFKERNCHPTDLVQALYQISNLTKSRSSITPISVVQSFRNFAEMTKLLFYDDVIKWKHFPRYGPFVPGIHRWRVNSPHKGQWHGALMFSLICAWTNGWTNNRDAGNLRRHGAHYDVTVMCFGGISYTATPPC